MIKSGCGTFFVENAFATVPTIFSCETRSRQIGAVITWNRVSGLRERNEQSVVTVIEPVLLIVHVHLNQSIVAYVNL